MEYKEHKNQDHKTIMQFYVKHVLYHVTLLSLIGLITSCALEEETFEALEAKISHPSAIAHDGQRFYVVNSDMERVHNAGSILTLDREGRKIGVVATPRLGRFIVVRPPFIMVGYAPTDQFKTPPQLLIYDARLPTQLKVYKAFSLGCSPISAVAPQRYNYFAVSCDDGQIYVGFFNSYDTKNLPQVSLRLVRDYGPHARRAIHIDTKNHHLYAFSTDWQRSDFQDLVLEDSIQFSATEPPPEVKTPVDFGGVVSSRSAVPLYEVRVPNEVPDIWEESTQYTVQEQHAQHSQYQVAILDLKALVASGFALESRYSDVSLSEFRWLYFHSQDSAATVSQGRKYYRSNFWQAMPDPQDSTKFFISQRGMQTRERNVDVNAIYEVQISGSPFFEEDESRTQDTDQEGSAVSAPTHPPISSFLKFKKVWGYRAQSTIYARSLRNSSLSQGPHVNSSIRFTGNFDMGQAFGSRYFLINDFRDPALFNNNAYSLTLTAGSGAQQPDDLLLFTDRSRSYFAISAIKDRVLAGTFYTHTLSLFDVTEDQKLRFIKDIR